MPANDKQVGGDHYRTEGPQHWDMVHQFKLDYFQGQITKYLFRWRKKHGLEDLLKAQHYLEKYMELEFPGHGKTDATTMHDKDGKGYATLSPVAGEASAVLTREEARARHEDPSGMLDGRNAQRVEEHRVGERRRTPGFSPTGVNRRQGDRRGSFKPWATTDTKVIVDEASPFGYVNQDSRS